MTRFIIIRHGHSMANLERSFAGHTDAPLSPIGEKQVEKTAEYVASKYNVDKIYASDLKRAYSTAVAVSEKTGIDIIPDENLREIYAGDWEGQLFDRLCEDYSTEYGIWKNDIGNARCTGGESVKELSERIIKELLRLAEENPKKTVVIATHATPVRVVMRMCKGMSFDEMKDIPWVSNASVTEVVCEDGVFRLIEAGVDEHLKDLATALPKNV